MSKVTLQGSSKSGWWCYAAFNKKKQTITWYHDDQKDMVTKLSKSDIKEIKKSLKAKTGSIYKSSKDMDLKSLVIEEKVVVEKPLL